MSHQQLQNGGHLFSCDGCPLGGEEFDKLDFREAVNMLTQNGWAMRRNPAPLRGGWQHFCKECVKTGVLRDKITEEEKKKYEQGAKERRAVRKDD